MRKRTLGNTNSARTDEVFDKISLASIPANPNALARIKSLIESDIPESPEHRNEIIREVIGDPGLGYFYLTHLRSALNLDIIPESPLTPILTMSTSELKRFFDVKASEISKHRLSDAGPPQILRHQHSFIASRAAANLAHQFSLDQGKAFSLVQMNQSAMNLLAWSYPTQFHKALFNKRRFKAPIEESLSSLVGVRAENITNKLAKKIGMPTSLLLDLQMTQRAGAIDLTNLPSSPTALSVARLGDLLAKANDQEHYPEALSQWLRVEKQLEERGLVSPKTEIQDNIKSFINEIGGQSSLPYSMALFQTQEPKKSEITTKFADPSILNPFFRKVPEKLKPIFEAAYEEIETGYLSAKALQILVEDLAPAIKVKSGCLYLMKGDKLTLQPTLNFGSIKRARDNISVHANSPVAQSIFSGVPHQFDSSGDITICGSLQNCQKQAVLTLEFDRSSYKDLGDKSFAIFSALCASLVDAMGQKLIAT